ncbi:hypothetical protein FOQG_12734 [Fusarium oxysporum f. sp. raphani 54005]|uniref:Uncharacterized protein n=1 Tax=Fusarium oxysporum f. sp. raphani 54005 TaxID=1089458 RepID=X0BMI6_FUSOX|nr:hypothetical protein FOQG_12734 [Fusarium oxysporum f. sp. raphani 54005]
MITIASIRPRVSTFRSLQRLSTIQTINISSKSPLDQRWITEERRKSKAPQNESSEPNPSYPAFSLNSLGLSKRTKVVIMVVLSIFGTIETWVWCKAIWQWRKGRQEAEQ